VIWLTIAAMAVVTFVPRIIPFFLGRNLNLPPWVRRWLAFFPAAALGGLIFPGILSVVPDKPWLGPAACACAALVAWKARNSIFPVLVGIAVAVALELVF
jgi:branched-subunit amino acid transport protein